MKHSALKKLICCLSVLVVAQAITTGSCASAQHDQGIKCYALLVGVEHYDGINSWTGTDETSKKQSGTFPNLPACLNDIESLYKELQSQHLFKGRVIALVAPMERLDSSDPNMKDMPADGAQQKLSVMGALNKIACEAAPGDVVFVYFTGHGFYDSAWNQLFLILPNSDHSTPNTTVDTCLTFEDLIAPFYNNKINLVFMLDVGHSGTRRDAGIVPYLKDLLTTSNQGSFRMVISSSESGQQSYSMSDNSNSVFTHCILQAINGGAVNPITKGVSLTDLITYLVYWVPIVAEKQQGGGLQNIVQLQYSGCPAPAQPLWYPTMPVPTPTPTPIPTPQPTPTPPLASLELFENHLRSEMQRIGVNDLINEDKLQGRARDEALWVVQEYLECDFPAGLRDSPGAVRLAQQVVPSMAPFDKLSNPTPVYDAWETDRLGLSSNGEPLSDDQRAEKRTAWIEALREYLTSAGTDPTQYWSSLLAAGIPPELDSLPLDVTDTGGTVVSRNGSVSVISGDRATIRFLVRDLPDSGALRMFDAFAITRDHRMGGRGIFSDAPISLPLQPVKHTYCLPVPTDFAEAIPCDFHVTLVNLMVQLNPGPGSAFVSFPVNLYQRSNEFRCYVSGTAPNGAFLCTAPREVTIIRSEDLVVDTPATLARERNTGWVAIAGRAWLDGGERPVVAVNGVVLDSATYVEDAEDKGVYHWEAKLQLPAGTHFLNLKLWAPHRDQPLVFTRVLPVFVADAVTPGRTPRAGP